MAPLSVADKGPRADGAPAPMWQFVTLGDYEPPPADVVETTRRRITAWWRRLRPDLAEPIPYAKPDEDLSRLPERRLRRAAPPPSWSDAAEGLDAAVKDGLTDPPRDESVRSLVTPPHVDRGAIITAWAQREGWRILSPPSAEQILAGDEAWLSRQWNDDGPWVLPNLEQVYLRDAEGLDLICSFLDRAHAGGLGCGLIGCESWAWAYLGHVWGGWLPPALTLQAYDEARLAVCFRSLAAAGGLGQARFRQSDDGNDVLPPPGEATTENHRSEFVHHLATYSRGNLAVAWAIWRTALSSEPLEDAADVDQVDSRAAGQTIWVTPWARLQHPSVPSGSGRDAAFVLHALLLHGGLPANLLPTLLPLSQGRVAEMLHALRIAGLISEGEGRWRVTATGYPAVREFLQTNGYLTDAF